MLINLLIKRPLGPKGQIVIPKDIRDFLGLKPGSEVTLEVVGNEIIIKPTPTIEDFLTQFCSAPRKVTKNVDIEKIIDEEYGESW